MLTRPDTPMDEDGWGDVIADIRRLYSLVTGGGNDLRNDMPGEVNAETADDGFGGTGGIGTAGGGGGGGSVANGNTIYQSYITNEGPIYFSATAPTQSKNVLVYNHTTKKIEWSNISDVPSINTSVVSLTFTDTHSLGLQIGEVVISIGGPGEWQRASKADVGGVYGYVTDVQGNEITVAIRGVVPFVGACIPGQIYYADSGSLLGWGTGSMLTMDLGCAYAISSATIYFDGMTHANFSAYRPTLHTTVTTGTYVLARLP